MTISRPHRVLDRVSLPARTAWFAVAALPLVLLRLMESPSAFTRTLALALLLAAVLEFSALVLLRRPLRLAWHDESACATALLLPLWFAAALPPAALLTGLLAALGYRLAAGGMGRTVFHPAVVGIAVIGASGLAGTPVHDAVPIALETHWPWLLACTVSAALLAWRLRRDLRAALALVLGLAFADVIARRLFGMTIEPTWTQVALAAAVIATDPMSTPSGPQARIVFGVLTAAVAALLAVSGAAVILPAALLLAQAASPALDRLTRTRAARPGASPA